MTKEDIQKLLEEHHVPFEEWGKGSAKTLDHLVKEVQQGESELAVSSVTLIRRVRIAWIHVYCEVNGKTYRLKEEVQIFTGGRERRRILPGSIGEKLQTGEQADSNLVQRALAEELGVQKTLSIRKLYAKDNREDSPSFPGLTMEAVNYFFEVKISPEEFKPEGYSEVQSDKVTFFVWEVI